jgi:deazaflavin-dependent oxidoreductase (nitroreductase family)
MVQNNGARPGVDRMLNAIERIPYPSNPLLKWSLKLPILWWRLGLGWIAGRLVMILTTTGRKSGLPRYTVVKYHTWRGKKYVFSAWGERAYWVQNILADPYVTIQTARGIERVIARRVTGDDDLAEAFGLIERNLVLRRWSQLLLDEISREAFIAGKDRYTLLTFDPTDAPTPPPLARDWIWVWGVIVAWVGLRRLRRGG